MVTIQDWPGQNQPRCVETRFTGLSQGQPVVGGAGDEVLGELEKRVQQVGGQVVAAALRQKVRDHKEPSAGDHLWMSFITHFLQGVSKKRYFSDFLSYFSSRGWILLFHMCFGIRILSPFHLAIQKVSIQNINCPKNAKNACADMILSLLNLHFVKQG